MLTYATKYILRKDTPTHKAGVVLRWDGITQFFYFTQRDNYDEDRNGPRFTVQEIQDGEWFEPANEIRPFIPAFPVEDKIEEYAHLHGECRLVDSVDECRALNELLSDETFQHRLYEFYRQQYNEFHGLEK